MLSSQFSNIRRTRFDQSSPVQPILDFRGGAGGSPERDTGAGAGAGAGTGAGAGEGEGAGAGAEEVAGQYFPFLI